MPDQLITIPDVEVLRADDVGVRVRIRSREVLIGRLQLAPGHPPPPPGVRGSLVLLRGAAWDLGLLPRPEP